MLSKLRELIRAKTTGRSTLLIACLAGMLFLGSWATIHHGFFNKHQIIDTPLYQRYGDWMAHGSAPYRDFAIEYPPGALPAFMLPTIGNSDSSNTAPEPYRVRAEYRRNFEFLMAVCGLVSIVLAAIALRLLGSSNGRAAMALGLLALTPLMVGPVILSRFDLWPVMIAMAGLVAILTGLEWIGFLALGLATAVKIFPVVLLPIACIWVWKRRGWRELAACLGIFVAALAACYAPFAILAPHGVWHSISVQLGRPLQIESLGAASLVALHHLFGLGVSTVSGSGSQNLAASGSGLIAIVQTVLQAAALLATWIWFARGEADGERLVRASATAIVAFVAFGKVLSPQYMIWLCPFVLLVLGRRGIAASALLVVSLVLTQLWFPYHYWDYAIGFGAWQSAVVLLRDVVLVALFATLLADVRSREQELPVLQPAAIQSEI
ncbi:MAG TPA: glycosyltransferase family 87 protein [Gaiellaceae bacterium]|jgi:Glycosyltransferase family 87